MGIAIDGTRARRGLYRIALLLATIFATSPPSAGADVLLDWNATMARTLADLPPFPAARLAAITQLAVFEAVNAITAEYEPYLAAGVAMVRRPAASLDAAAATAASAVLTHYAPENGGPLRAALAESLAAIADGQAKTEGIALGRAAAAAMIARRAADGAALPEFYSPDPPAAGRWQATPSCAGAGGRGAFYHWRKVAPFAVPAVAAFRPGPPPALHTAAYTRDFEEVRRVGRIDSALRQQDRSDVARFYAITSPVTWANAAARQIAGGRGYSPTGHARALALLNMAISDAAVAVFDVKYHYNTWRPETAIRSADRDDNPHTAADLSFAPAIVAPCFPSYPSAHAALSAAAREVLERLYGGASEDITLANPGLGLALHYTDLEHLVHDIDDARVYGGIHFRFDQDAGGTLGRNIAAYVVQHQLRVAPGR